MVTIAKAKVIHKPTKEKKKGIEIPLDVQAMIESKGDWKILKFKGPSQMFDWLDKNKKLNKINYSEFLFKLFVDYHKLKPILEKILSDQELSAGDILLINQVLQMEKVK